jgi:RNA polymerase sigma factor for flagellar operon FliA
MPHLHAHERPASPVEDFDEELPSRRQRLDPAVRRKLIEDHVPMVRRVAFRLASRYPSCVDVDDLINMGMLGLIDAVDRFEADRSISFTAYARIRVQGAIVDEMRKVDWVPRSVRDRGDRIKVSREKLSRDLGREPTEAELARDLGVSETRLRELNDHSLIHSVVSMQDGLDDDHNLGDLIPHEGATPGEVLEASDFRDRVRSAVGQLPERDRMIVDLYYFKELGFREIGQVLGVTESRVSQLHTRIMERLRPLLAGVNEER